MADDLNLTFYGRQADQGQLNLYDAGRSVTGLGRTLSVLSEYCLTGRIIVQAPSARSEINLRSTRQGSFTLDVAANVFGGVIGAPFILYVTYLFKQWLPGNSEQQQRQIDRLRQRLEIAEVRSEALQQAIQARDNQAEVADELRIIRDAVIDRQNEHDVLRSITAGSFREIFRPIGRSADLAIIYSDRPGAFAGSLNANGLAQLDSDIPDDETVELSAIVTAFSRNSKTGIAMSRSLGRGFRFHYGALGPLGREDDFSWSQYRQREIVMRGRFYRFF